MSTKTKNVLDVLDNTSKSAKVVSTPETAKVETPDKPEPKEKVEEEVKDEVSEVKPKEVDKPEVTPPKAPAQPSKDNRMLNKYFKEHLDKFSKHYVNNYKDVESVKVHMALFSNVINYVITNPELELFDQLVDFFRETRDTTLNPYQALIGIRSLPATMYDRCSLLYTLLRDITDPKGFNPNQINMSALEQGVGNRKFVQMLSKYFASL